MDKNEESGIIKTIGLFSVPAPPLRFAAIGGVFFVLRPTTGLSASGFHRATTWAALS